jgi:formamidopyrimidine-DNA glycosylase
MPELPEVEIVRENLERWLVGRRILKASASDRRLRGRQSRASLSRALEGATVRSVARRGKFLLLDLGLRRKSVVAHLGMTGKFVRLGRGDAEPRYVRASISIGRDERIVFCDARRFGQFRLLDEQEEKRLGALGIEPLGGELTAARLHLLAGRSRQPIKLFLMDQSKIAGVGNIHAAEALFRAGLHPEREARSLDRRETSRLIRALRHGLTREIVRSRSESPAYLHEGSENRFLIYGRKGEPCPRCRSTIRRLVQGGRSSYFCPSCQPEKA